MKNIVLSFIIIIEVLKIKVILCNVVIGSKQELKESKNFL